MSTEMERMITAIVTILLGIVGVATLTTLVSSQSNTAGVIGAGSTGFACALRTAITGTVPTGCGGTSVNSTITYPGLPNLPGVGSPGANCFTSRGC
jgi:hypothetical protein